MRMHGQEQGQEQEQEQEAAGQKLAMWMCAASALAQTSGPHSDDSAGAAALNTGMYMDCSVIFRFDIHLD